MSTYVSQSVQTIQAQIDGKYLVHGTALTEMLLVAYFSGGHVLIEGPPGTGKTMTAKLLAHILSKSFNRIQFTSDLLPADILGSNIFSPATQSFQLIRGPIFADVIVADEINRTPPRTQSALLEAMEERQTTIEGKRYPLSTDFFVVATQNPQDYEGTFALPEVQLDRFLMKLKVSHAPADAEVELFKKLLVGELPPVFSNLRPVELDRKRIETEIRDVTIDDSLLSYVADLLAATRTHPMLANGSSARGGIALIMASRVLASFRGRTFVTPDDVKFLAPVTLSHRIRLNSEAQVSSATEDQVIQEILETVAFPV